MRSGYAHFPGHEQMDKDIGQPILLVLSLRGKTTRDHKIIRQYRDGPTGRTDEGLMRQAMIKSPGPRVPITRTPPVCIDALAGTDDTSP